MNERKTGSQTHPPFPLISGTKLIVSLVITLCVLAISLTQALTTAAQSPTDTPTTPLQCGQVLQQAMKNLSTRCNALNTNEVCYGNDNLAVQFDRQSPKMPFANVGDIVPITSIKQLSATGLDMETGTWGLAVFKLMADVPGATAGQAVTFIMYGDTQLDTAVPASRDATPIPTPVSCTATTRRAVFLRDTADPNGQQIQLLPANTELKALGREPDADNWVQVQFQDKVGFIFLGNNNASLSCNLSQLPDLGPAALPLTGPGGGTMYFTTNVGPQATCQDVSASGLIVKSPAGQRVRMHLNGADITIGSTVLIKAQPMSKMTVSVIEGKAWVRAEGFDEIAQTGQFIDVPLGSPVVAVPVPTGESSAAQPTSVASAAIVIDYSDRTASGPPSKPASIQENAENRVDQTTACSLLSSAGIANPCTP